MEQGPEEVAGHGEERDEEIDRLTDKPLDESSKKDPNGDQGGGGDPKEGTT